MAHKIIPGFLFLFAQGLLSSTPVLAQNDELPAVEGEGVTQSQPLTVDPVVEILHELDDRETELNQVSAESEFTPEPADRNLLPIVADPSPLLHASELDKRLAQAMKQLFLGDGQHKISLPDDSLAAFYAARDFVPYWYKDGKLTPFAHQALARFRKADTDGLRVDDYYFGWSPDLPVPVNPKEDDDLISRELTLSSHAVRYFQQARSGRLDPQDIPGDVGFKRKVLPDGRVMATLATYDDVDKFFDWANPTFPMFSALKRQLDMIVRAEELASSETVVLPGFDDFYYKPVEAVRQISSLYAPKSPRLAARMTPDPAREDHSADFTPVPSYDVEPVITFSLKDLMKFVQHRKDDITATMEMTRWLPDYLGNDLVWVNIPEYEVRVIKQKKLIYQGRVVVGTPVHRTPIFSDTIEFAVVNPYWNVPKSIAIHEMIPKIIKNGGLGSSYEIVSPNGYVVSAASIKTSWSGAINDGYRFRQLPMQGNALGTVKFLFPNQFSVYLHDTPAKSLFERKTRAYSHGCIRLAEPWVFADIVSQFQPEPIIDGMQEVKGRSKEEWFELEQTIPVAITYLPFIVDDKGSLFEVDDVYGYLQIVRQKLGLG